MKLRSNKLTLMEQAKKDSGSENHNAADSRSNSKAVYVEKCKRGAKRTPENVNNDVEVCGIVLRSRTTTKHVGLQVERSEPEGNTGLKRKTTINDYSYTIVPQTEENKRPKRHLIRPPKLDAFYVELGAQYRRFPKAKIHKQINQPLIIHEGNLAGREEIAAITPIQPEEFSKVLKGVQKERSDNQDNKNEFCSNGVRILDSDVGLREKGMSDSEVRLETKFAKVDRKYGKKNIPLKYGL